MTMSAFDPWSYRQDTGYSTGLDLVGYQIAATDGDIGKVDQATYEAGAALPQRPKTVTPCRSTASATSARGHYQRFGRLMASPQACRSR
jgi:hypothetical protein